MAKLLTVSEMIAIEKAADAGGHSYADMMQRAGRSIADSIVAHSHKAQENVLALVGKGNNGGDALISLASLSRAGFNTTAILVERREDDPLVSALESVSGTVLDYSELSDEDIRSLVLSCDIFMDALLGTGVRLPLRDPAARILKLIGEYILNLDERPIIFAVDCPSGMDVNTGEIAPETIPADVSLSMAAVKKGMLSFPAFEFLGDLQVGEIGIPPELIEWQAIEHFVVDDEAVAASLPPRSLNSHKGDFGKTLIIAGSDDYPGAALLAAKAAARSGAGLISLTSHSNLRQSLAGHIPEITWHSLAVNKDKRPAQNSLRDYSSILIGPGLTPEVWKDLEIDQIFKMKDHPNLVLDAEALRVLAKRKAGPTLLANCLF